MSKMKVRFGLDWGRNASKGLVILIIAVCLGSCAKDEKSALSSSSGIQEKLDDGGKYLKTQFYIADLNGKELSKDQASNMNIINLCERHSGFCQSTCINSIYWDIKRYSLAYSGYTHSGPDGCSFYIFGVNSDDGNPSYKYYSGTYFQPNSAKGNVLGYCTGFNLASPKSQGRYSFVENRVLEGDPTPDPARRRLYYTLDFQKYDKTPNGRMFLSSYEPYPDAHTVYIFSDYNRWTWQEAHGYTCVRENQITNSVIEDLR